MSLIVANWKMNTLPSDAAELAKTVSTHSAVTTALNAGTAVVLCPPFTSLHAVAPHTSARLALGAQNCAREDSGAFTGEIGAPMLVALGCTYVILGHSERRRDQFETNEIIGMKAKRALEHGLTPIVCIGESLEERITNRTVEVLRAQIDGIVSTSGATVLAKCIVAYEPVWAIGTGKSASTEQIESTHTDIIMHLGITCGVHIRVLYGGSVTSANAKEILSLPGVSGALVGGASLKADEFGAIVAASVRT